jgi:hypothetical protein
LAPLISQYRLSSSEGWCFAAFVEREMVPPLLPVVGVRAICGCGAGHGGRELYVAS